MKIALVGGTGDIGTGFAVRWGQKHEIIIGSRNVDKARESVAAVLQFLGAAANVWGTDNASAVAAADVVVLCVPYEHLASVTADLSDSYKEQIVISPVVPMIYNGKFFLYLPPTEGSAAMQARSLLPKGVKVVSAFHTICAAALQDIERAIKGDAFICGDGAEAIDITIGLASEIKGLRPLRAGPLSVSSMVESLTPFLLNVARKNKIKNAGVAIVSERKI
ncbi:MAG: NADPH-dependent F420 reductase [Methanotrichaceae archaeon]|nr:NADPH-dependent F420 reductase [Methanotrichaceae archaeon]